MNTAQIEAYYKEKRDYDCPLTKKLIMAGYQQESKGYIQRAKDEGLKVDYREAEPNQGWHLIESYCKNTKDYINFPRTVKCGELIFWMAEVADCVEKSKMEKLVEDIINSGEKINVSSVTKPNVKYDRSKWNKEIHELCFDNIVKTVEQAQPVSK